MLTYSSVESQYGHVSLREDHWYKVTIVYPFFENIFFPGMTGFYFSQTALRHLP